MNDSRTRPARHPPPTPDSPSHRPSQLGRVFASDAGFQQLGNVANDEQKILQDTRRILEERLNLDRQYAKDLQELTAKADRIAWPTETYPIAAASRELLLRWSHEATTIDANADKFRRHVLDDFLRSLMENKADARRFIDEHKRLFDSEHRKAQSDADEAERHYQTKVRSYTTKNNDLNKASAGLRKGNDNRELKRQVIDKRDHVYRAHNDYVLALREYNAIDAQHVRKIRNLLAYYEDVQLLLNRQWQSILKSVADYGSNALSASPTVHLLSTDPSRYYDEVCKVHSSLPALNTRPISFNELLLQTSGLTELVADQIFVDSTAISDLAINALRQRVRVWTEEVDKANADLLTTIRLMDQLRDKRSNYYGRKDYFEQEQQADNLRMRISSRDSLKSDLHYASNIPTTSVDTLPYQEILMALSDRLEDQAYFHGRIPRSQSVQLLTEKGDYLLRMNDQGKVVLSILWTDPVDSQKLKDGHYYIYEKDGLYYFQTESIGQPTISKLIIHYARQRLELRNDGTHLIRPVEKPDYIINNDEIRLHESIGGGHFGVVNRGEYRMVPVAVKVLRPATGALSPKDRENFVNEALFLKRFKHKHIVNFIGIAAYREPLMLVMELVEKGSLNNYLKANDLRVSQLTQMCYEIAKGMAYLESCNVIHRDLAARNCLVDKNSRVKVADFGLSRCLQDDQEYFTQTKEFPVRWWAVETFARDAQDAPHADNYAWQSLGPYTTKADVWSYGVTVWEIFSRAALPYPSIPHNHLVIDAVKRGERLRQPEKCPESVYEIMKNCWLADPRKRRSFKEIAELMRRETSSFPKPSFFSTFK